MTSAARSARVSMIMALITGLLIASSLFVWVFRGRLALGLLGFDSSEKSFSRAGFDRIATQILSDALTPDEDGRVVLPHDSKQMTSDGMAYVTRRPGLTLILFPTWRGKGSNVKGYLFCSRPLARSELHRDYYTGKSEAIQVVGPSPSVSTPTGPVEVVLNRRADRQWYSVSHLLD